jgi:hypothetical protein
MGCARIRQKNSLSRLKRIDYDEYIQIYPYLLYFYISLISVNNLFEVR